MQAHQPCILPYFVGVLLEGPALAVPGGYLFGVPVGIRLPDPRFDFDRGVVAEADLGRRRVGIGDLGEKTHPQDEGPVIGSTS